MTVLQFVEVSPRDGLQNEKAIISTASKIELIHRAARAGARRIEVASFVHPVRVPQMADAEAVLAGLGPLEGVITIGLVLNKRGVLRALETSVDELGLVCVASDRFGQENQGQSSADSLEMACDGIRFSLGQGRRAQATIAVAFGCPFAGPTDPLRVVEMAREIAAAGAHEVALADTIGIARPFEVERLVTLVREAIAPLPVRIHLHDTRGMGVANALAAVRGGATVIDGSIGGTGGCPFAPGSAGNVASEDLAYAIDGALGLDLPRLVDAAHWLNGQLGRERISAVARTMGRTG